MDIEQVAARITLWIREKVLAAGCKGVVAGMSGGVDSSITALLCQRAFPQNMLGLVMPCHSNPKDEEHARLVAERFSLPVKKVNLEPVFDTLLKVLPDDGSQPASSQLAEANLKARLRMLTLYYYANRLRYMVAGSSNRSELTVGYFTKYGDGGVDILPLGNLAKGQVKELAQFLGIPQPIIDKPPSAGLWTGQTDEGELGFSYSQLDRYLLTGEADEQLKKKVESLKAANAHKLQLPQSPDFSV